ncbi:MAG TPA: hypothetical protein VKU60_04800 [Chloroflexota bacterium]|nr:hypothetical protein [Chloroflexota bacterium]
MADETPEVVWVKNAEGKLRGFHGTCAQWLKLEGSTESRPAYHTELCRGCGRFLDATPPEHTGPPPEDVGMLLN